MQLSPIHHSGKGVGIARILFRNNLFYFIQVLFIMGMLILAAHSLNIVISLHRKDDIILLKQPFIICPVKNSLLFLLYILRVHLPAKVPTVMTEPYILAIQIFPGPV